MLLLLVLLSEHSGTAEPHFFGPQHTPRRKKNLFIYAMARAPNTHRNERLAYEYNTYSHGNLSHSRASLITAINCHHIDTTMAQHSKLALLAVLSLSACSSPCRAAVFKDDLGHEHSWDSSVPAKIVAPAFVARGLSHMGMIPAFF